jgi:hypothetical protein
MAVTDYAAPQGVGAVDPDLMTELLKSEGPRVFAI